MVIGVSAIGRDVTKEKEAAQHARNMASIIKYSNDSITSVDLDGIITSVNPAAERLYGYMAEEMIGQPTSRFTSQENIHEIANILRNIEAGDQIKPYETLRFSKDGRPIPISMTISPMYNEKGEIIARSSISRDISVEKEAAQYARNLASIIISSNDAIATGDTDMNFTSWNSAAERMFGYSAAEMIGQSFSRLTAPETIHEDHENFKNLLAGKTVEPYETVRLTKAGNPIPIFLTVSAIYDDNGVLIGLSSIARNLTQEQLVIRQLQELNELRNEFVSTVAHDLRAPMASISGFAHLLIDEWSATADEKKIEYLRIITRNTDGLADFVEDVLQVARIEAGEYTYTVQPFDIGVLVQRAMSEAIGPHSVRTFELKCPDELPLVLGDEARLWQVLTNLLSNAIKFSPVLEPIVIELANVGDLVQVAVKDGGIGIAKEDLSKLFRKSGRLIKSGHPTISGNGLGLFICKTLVEAQGGELWCESIPGKSSTFFFTIPVAR